MSCDGPGATHSAGCACWTERIRAEARAPLQAEIEMLRGVGCLEDGDGPCGVCLKCAKAAGAAEERARQKANG